MSSDSKASPFDSFKSQIKCNLKNLKKEKETNNQPFPALGAEALGSASPREIAAMAKYHWTEEVPSFIYSDDIRKLDLYYNIL